MFTKWEHLFTDIKILIEAKNPGFVHIMEGKTSYFPLTGGF